VRNPSPARSGTRIITLRFFTIILVTMTAGNAGRASHVSRSILVAIGDRLVWFLRARIGYLFIADALLRLVYVVRATENVVLVRR
jgi:hypothetical protein